jgi:hypothetical protein
LVYCTKKNLATLLWCCKRNIQLSLILINKSRKILQYNIKIRLIFSITLQFYIEKKRKMLFWGLKRAVLRGLGRHFKPRRKMPMTSTLARHFFLYVKSCKKCPCRPRWVGRIGSCKYHI